MKLDAHKNHPRNDGERLKTKWHMFYVSQCSCTAVCYSLAALHDAVMSQTHISPSDQFILFENHELHDVVGDIELVSVLVHTSPSNPLYLFSVTDASDSAAVDSVLLATVRKLHSTYQ